MCTKLVVFTRKSIWPYKLDVILPFSVYYCYNLDEQVRPSLCFFIDFSHSFFSLFFPLFLCSWSLHGDDKVIGYFLQQCFVVFELYILLKAYFLFLFNLDFCFLWWIEISFFFKAYQLNLITLVLNFYHHIVSLRCEIFRVGLYH